MAELFNKLNWVDIFALILLLRIGYVSSRLGVGKQILPTFLLSVILLTILGTYIDIAYFFIKQYTRAPSTCKFFSYSILSVLAYAIYKFISRVTRLFLFPDQNKMIPLERVGGTLLGIVRAFIIIGLIFIGFLLTPIRFIEDSVKASYTGEFFVITNLKFYTCLANFISQKKKVIYSKALADIVAKKDSYFFGPIDIKQRSRFFKEKY